LASPPAGAAGGGAFAPISASWLREMASWEGAVRVPGDYPTLAVAVAACPSGAHILLAAGIHVLEETLVVGKHVQILGEMSPGGLPMSCIKSLQARPSVPRSPNSVPHLAPLPSGSPRLIARTRRRERMVG
jgi:hypothetical protein